MTVLERVVFDCNVLFQALISIEGPASVALEAAKQGQLTLFISSYVLQELSDVASRPRVAARYRLSDEQTAAFIDDLKTNSVLVQQIPHVFELPRDPKDAHFVDLAVAARAQLIVSRDNDLLALGDSSTPDGKDFALRFPDISILTPPELLERFRASSP